MTARDIVMSAAGNSGDSKTYIEDVFSTYLYTGNNSTQTITNGIDLAGKGGMVWFKSRTAAEHNALIDTARGNTKVLISNTTGANNTDSSAITSFDSAGFSLGAGALGFTNNSAQNFASWTFRKAPKFFDVVTYTGTGAVQTINHSLGQTPGMIIVKKTSGTGNWFTWHTSVASAFGNNTYLYLDSDSSYATYNGVFGVPTSTTFTVGADATTSANGATYVAYLFAHDTTTDGLIQCGSYTGNGSATGPTVNLGWEPQYLMIKNTQSAGSWQIVDNMRGMSVGSVDAALKSNSSAAESSAEYVSPTATGFQVTSTSYEVNRADYTYIYMAIRRGPMRTPTDGTKVFKPLARTGNSTTTKITSIGFPPDTVIIKNRDSGGLSLTTFQDKLRSVLKYLTSTSTVGETQTASTDSFVSYDQLGYTVGADTGDWYWNDNGRWYVDYAFRRAPGFFDVVCYTGDATEVKAIQHNLTVAPEFLIVKRRDSASTWFVYQKDLGNKGRLGLQETNAAVTTANTWASTTPTATNFYVNFESAVNAAGSPFVAYLFASCPGVSKVGSYTGSETVTQQINCGFTNGARFVLIKRTDAAGDWWVFDTARGIVAAADPALRLNQTLAESSVDFVDPYAAGFELPPGTSVNTGGATYIYLAIA